MEPNPAQNETNKMKVFDYFMTITFRTDIDTNVAKAYESTVRGICRTLRHSTEFEMYPELTVAGRIHYHLMLNITDKVKFYKSCLPRLKRENGYIDIQKIKNMINTRTYCQKDVKLAADLFLQYEVNKAIFPITNDTFTFGYHAKRKDCYDKKNQDKGFDNLNFIDHAMIEARRKDIEDFEKENQKKIDLIGQIQFTHEEKHARSHPIYQYHEGATYVIRDKTPEYKTVYDMYHTTA